MCNALGNAIAQPTEPGDTEDKCHKRSLSKLNIFQAKDQKVNHFTFGEGGGLSSLSHKTKDSKGIVMSKILGLKQICVRVKGEFNVCKSKHTLFSKFHEEDKPRVEL